MTNYIRLPDELQPYGVELKMADGVFIKQMAVPKAGTVIPQHSHTYDHTSMLAVGAVRAWADDKFLGEFAAPTGLTIKANTKHRFETLVDNTIIYCIHNVSRSGDVDVDLQHELDFD